MGRKQVLGSTFCKFLSKKFFKRKRQIFIAKKFTAIKICSTFTFLQTFDVSIFPWRFWTSMSLWVWKGFQRAPSCCWAPLAVTRLKGPSDLVLKSFGSLGPKLQTRVFRSIRSESGLLRSKRSESRFCRFTWSVTGFIRSTLSESGFFFIVPHGLNPDFVCPHGQKSASFGPHGHFESRTLGWTLLMFLFFRGDFKLWCPYAVHMVWSRVPLVHMVWSRVSFVGLHGLKPGYFGPHGLNPDFVGLRGQKTDSLSPHGLNIVFSGPHGLNMLKSGPHGLDKKPRPLLGMLSSCLVYNKEDLCSSSN